jgi:hypothetical protein
MSRFARHARGKHKPQGIKHKVHASKERFRVVSTAVALAIVLCCVVIFSYYLVRSLSARAPSPQIVETNGNSEDNTLKVALIDALYSTYPNLDFSRSLNRTLVEAGFRVDIYEGNEVTVDFLKKLKGGYKLVILRMHSALSSHNELYFFTDEPYSEEEHTEEQFPYPNVRAATADNVTYVFAVNWGFVKMFMTGKFNGTLVVAMGCDGARDSWLAREFVNQGAIGYIAWSGPVLLSHSDQAIQYLIESLYKEKLRLEDAVERTNNQIGADPDSGAILDLYHS